LQSARHENILGVLGWTKWEDGVAIIMEYMPGGNIWNLVSDPDVTISPLLQLRLCNDISSGISHIHNLFPSKARLVHGDIKPENILLTENLQCKIADFGGSRLAAAADSVMSVINRMQPIKEKHITKIYAAPEVLLNPLADLKHTHDTYCFGIVVYEILASTKPNQNCIVKEEYETAIKQGKRPDISRIETIECELEKNNEQGAKIIATLKNAMKNCWSHDPLDRPEMSNVHRELSNLLATFSKDDQVKAVQDALHDIEMVFPCYNKSETVPINKVRLPEPHEGKNNNLR